MAKNTSFTLKVAKFFKNMFMSLVFREVSRCKKAKEDSCIKEEDAERALEQYKENQRCFREECEKQEKEAEELLKTWLKPFGALLDIKEQ